jgi:hypothetical protein
MREILRLTRSINGIINLVEGAKYQCLIPAKSAQHFVRRRHIIATLFAAIGDRHGKSGLDLVFFVARPG